MQRHLVGWFRQENSTNGDSTMPHLKLLVVQLIATLAVLYVVILNSFDIHRAWFLLPSFIGG